MSIHRIAFVVAMGVLLPQSAAAQVAPPAQGGTSDVAGLYTITLVNKKAIPSASWKREMSDTSCATATQNGTLMLDSRGRWAMLVTERDRCTRGTKRWTLPDVSTLSTGTYTAEGGTVTFTDQLTGTTNTAVLLNDRLTVNVSGIDVFAGQQATYVLRRQRATRAR